MIVVVQQAMNSQDLPAKDAPLTVNEQVTLMCLLGSGGPPSPPSQPTLAVSLTKHNFAFDLFAAVCSCHPPCASVPLHNGMINSHTADH